MYMYFTCLSLMMTYKCTTQSWFISKHCGGRFLTWFTTLDVDNFTCIYICFICLCFVSQMCVRLCVLSICRIFLSNLISCTCPKNALFLFSCIIVHIASDQNASYWWESWLVKYSKCYRFDQNSLKDDLLTLLFLLIWLTWMIYG